MKKNILLGLLVEFMFSCSTSKVVNNNDLTGSYYAETGDGYVKRGFTKYYIF